MLQEQQTCVCLVSFPLSAPDQRATHKHAEQDTLFLTHLVREWQRERESKVGRRPDQLLGQGHGVERAYELGDGRTGE